MSDDGLLSDEFATVPGYLDTASVGRPPLVAVEILRHRVDNWERGLDRPESFDSDIAWSRAAYARLVGTEPNSVGVMSQVSVVSGIVASSLPDRAVVLCAEEDFSSMLFPFLADQRLQVRPVPLDSLLDSVESGVDLVAVSAVQSADGRVLDLDQLSSRAEREGVKTYVDLTQAAGWLPIVAGQFDVTACHAYKWLCSPRGAGFLTVGKDTERLACAPLRELVCRRRPLDFDLPTTAATGRRRPPLQRLTRLVFLCGGCADARNFGRDGTAGDR